MKRFSLGIMTLLLGALVFAACSSSDDDDVAQNRNQGTNTENTSENNNSDNNNSGNSGSDAGNTDNGNSGNASSDSTSRTLVVYYSQKLPDGVDGTTGATDIVREGNNQYGANQYLAMLIARSANADTLRITVERGHYPSTYSELADFARNEADNNQHPTLTSRDVNMSDYDNVIISTPIWWFSLPMPILSFLDKYDLSDKHVYVATTHAGSGLANAISVIQRQEPNAIVSTNGLAVRASSVSANTASTVDSWLRQLGL